MKRKIFTALILFMAISTNAAEGYLVSSNTNEDGKTVAVLKLMLTTKKIECKFSDDLTKKYFYEWTTSEMSSDAKAVFSMLLTAKTTGNKINMWHESSTGEIINVWMVTN